MGSGVKIKIRFCVSVVMTAWLLLWSADQAGANAVAGKGMQVAPAPVEESPPPVSPPPAIVAPSAPAPISLAPTSLAPPASPPLSAPVAMTPAVVAPAAPPVVISSPAPAEKPAAAGQLLIKTGNHGGFTRVAFECPAMTNYHIVQADDVLHVTLDTKAVAKVTLGKTPQVKKVTASQEGDSLLVNITTTVPGASYKDFRFQNRIILDIYPAATKKAAAPAKSAAPVKEATKEIAPEKPAAPNPEQKQTAVAATPTAPIAITPQKKPLAEKATAAPVLPVDTAPVLSDPEAIASAQVGSKPAPLPTWNLSITKPDGGAPPQPKVPEAMAAPPVPAGDDRTVILTLSSLAPMRIAVFQRFGTLWIVTDATGADASPPTISGRISDLIAPAKVMRFKQGTAYSYALPQKFYIDVTRQNLSWQVVLRVTQPPPADDFLSSELSVKYDPKTNAAMLVSYMKGAGDPLSFDDPEVGDKLFVVPTIQQHTAVQEERHTADLEILPAAAGMVIRPLKDGVSVRHIMMTATPAAAEQKDAKNKAPEKAEAQNTVPPEILPVDGDAVVITAPSGLAVTPAGGSIARISGPEETPDENSSRLFDFPNWQRGGPEKLLENRQKLQEKAAAAQTPDERIGALMDLAKLYFSNNFGQETLGILDMVLVENPEMEKNQDFIALRGAASAMSGHYKEALQDLSLPAIQQHPEVNLWVGYAAAATEQWHMADRSFPKSNNLLMEYPDSIAIPFTLYMAESALHLGHTDQANELLDSINKSSSAFDPHNKAALDYLRGVAYSQAGESEKAITLWQPVAAGLDRLYHTKASLSLTRLLLQEKKITLKDAIDRVDSLRFAWRGDGLEVSILHTLGALKVQDGQILSGLEDMKHAADLADSMNDDSTPIRDDMKHIFTDLFQSDAGSRVKPLEVVSVYNEFNTLIPPGPEAASAALNFTDSLIRMDLLDKAADVMEDLVKKGALPPDKAPVLSAKLAAVYLLDSKPKQALAALQETEGSTFTPRIHEERLLLKARAQSQLGLTSDAIATLSTLNSKTAQRLKADVLWRAQKWTDAAAATEALMPADATKPLSDEDASYVMNAAVAWKLAGNADKLKEIKAKYGAVMTKTKLAPTFDVVTRDGGSSALADRETMLRIASEVDMFKGFLENYKAGLGSGS